MISTYNYNYYNNTGKNKRNHISYTRYTQFLEDWDKGLYAGQRFGQAFYNKFDSMPTTFSELFNESDQKKAIKLIEKNYKIYYTEDD